MEHKQANFSLVNGLWVGNVESFAPHGIYMNAADYAFGQGYYNGVWINIIG